MSLASHRGGTSFHKVPTATGLSPKQFAVLIRKAAETVGLNPTPTLIAQGLGTIEAEGGFDGSLWTSNSSQLGPWAEEASFGSEADRLDPWKSTLAAMKNVKENGGYQQAWWQWEEQQGEVETGKVRAAKYMTIAHEAMGVPAGVFHAQTKQTLSGIPGLEQAEEGVNAIGGAISSTEDFLTQVFHVLTDFRKLGQLAAEAMAWFIKLIGKAIWDYVVAPLLHWTERAVSFYWVNFFGSGTEKGSGVGYVLRNNAGTITILFWSLGYAILWSNGQETGMVAPHESMLGQGVKGIDAAIARRHLVKPKDVKKKTPDKPKEKVSKVPVEPQGTFSVSRKRPVTVTGQHMEGRQHGRSPRRFTPSPVPRPTKKLAIAKGYSRRAQSPPPKKPAEPGKPRMGTRPGRSHRA